MLTIIGDVHGYYDKYLNISSKCESTVQVGDFGFNYEVLNGTDPDNHKILGGNHDNYAIIGDCPNYLGDYGVANVGGVEFFFVRGENSVDKNMRIEGRNWWREEELDMNTAYKAIEAYVSAKPEVVITHGCPADIMPFFITNPSKQISPSRTSQMLDAMWNNHRPKLWVFGHHHNSQTLTVGDSVFRCLNELETMNIS